MYMVYDFGDYRQTEQGEVFVLELNLAVNLIAGPGTAIKDLYNVVRGINVGASYGGGWGISKG